MALDRFLIAPFKTGLQLDVRPWLIMDDAMQQLNNAYVFRGRIRKRPGSSLMNTGVATAIQPLYSRARINIGTTDSVTGDLTVTIPGASANYATLGKLFSVDSNISGQLDEMYTVYQNGTMLFNPGSIASTDVNGDASGTVPLGSGSIGMYFTIGIYTYTVAVLNGALTPSAGAPGSGTFNTANGAYTFTGVPASQQIFFFVGAAGTYNTGTGQVVITGSQFLNSTVWYYPANPIMGFVTFDSDQVDNEPLYAFDTQFAYKWNASSFYWQRAGTAVWTGSNLNYFWGCTYRGVSLFDYYLYVTNFNIPASPSVTPDYIKYYSNEAADFVNLNPVLNPTSRLVTGLMINPFKDRLCVYNVVESVSGSGVSQGTTNGTTGNITINPVTQFYNGVTTNPYLVGDNFLIGTTLYTVTDVTTPSNVDLKMSYATTGSSSAPLATGTFNGTTGELIITGNGADTNQFVYYISNGTPKSYNQYWNRLRYSKNGSPVSSDYTNPNDTNAWLDGVPGLGGYIDAPTKEAMVSSEYIKDRLIVYFENSTWEQAYTFNQVLPFVWQKINTELGAISPYSTVPFDKQVIAVGDVGIHSCNGSNVERIDDLIPDTIFNVSKENGGNLRIWGVRDYFAEMIYWSFQQESRYTPFNNKILAFNYKTKSWAIFDDSITAFGVFYNTSNVTWAISTFPWEQAYETWNSGLIQQQFRQVIAGNQQGYFFLIERDTGSNAPALQITNLVINSATTYFNVTSINHSLGYKQYVYIENCGGVTGINNNVFVVGIVIDNNTIRFFASAGQSFGGTYTGGGTLRRVSQIDILTKQYNFYVKEGRNALINKVDFQVDRTSENPDGVVNGVTVDYYISTAQQSSLTAGGASPRGTGTILGTGILETTPYPASPYTDDTLQYPLEDIQQQLWHPVYTWADGEFIQLHIYLSDTQIRDIDVAWADFQMHSMIFYTQPSSSRLQ